MNYLKLTDLRKSSEFIIKKCTSDDFKDECKELYNELKEKYDREVEEIGECDTTRYIFTDNSCNIYALQPVVKVGYIWKSTSLKKIDLFKIELIEEYPQKTQEQVQKSPTKDYQHYQHGYGYSSNIVQAQFPLTSFPIELSKELESKLKLLRESYVKYDDEDDSDNESSELVLETNSEFYESNTDNSSEEVLLKKKQS